MFAGYDVRCSQTRMQHSEKYIRVVPMHPRLRAPRGAYSLQCRVHELMNIYQEDATYKKIGN